VLINSLDASCANPDAEQETALQDGDAISGAATGEFKEAARRHKNSHGCFSYYCWIALSLFLESFSN